MLKKNYLVFSFSFLPVQKLHALKTEFQVQPPQRVQPEIIEVRIMNNKLGKDNSAKNKNG